MELKDYIDAGIEKMPNQTAVELARFLDQNPNSVRDARSHRRGIPVFACVSLAKLIGVDPLEIIAASELVTEKKEERRAVFLPFVQGVALAKHLAIATFATGLTVLEIATSLIKDI